MPQPSGVDVTFWTLNAVQLDAVSQTAVITLDGYINSDAKMINGCSPLVTQSVLVVFVPTNIITGISVMQAIYAKILLDPFFTDAVYTNDGV